MVWKKDLPLERSLAMLREKKTAPPIAQGGRSMSSFDLSYEEHAQIYSAAIVLVFRASVSFFPSLALALPAHVYRRLLVYCAGLCVLRKYQTCLGISRQLGGCSHDALTKGTAVGHSELAVGKDHIHMDIDRPHLPDLCGDSR